MVPQEILGLFQTPRLASPCSFGHHEPGHGSKSAQVAALGSLGPMVSESAPLDAAPGHDEG